MVILAVQLIEIRKAELGRSPASPVIVEGEVERNGVSGRITPIRGNLLDTVESAPMVSLQGSAGAIELAIVIQIYPCPPKDAHRRPGRNREQNVGHAEISHRVVNGRIVPPQIDRIHVPLGDAQWMYNFADVGMLVVVYPGDGSPVSKQLSLITTDDQGKPQSQ